MSRQEARAGERRTSVDDIYDQLYDEIRTLELRPGDRISEAEVAARFGVSRQPVRDAFNRLANLDLLLIRPQRATEVKRFSSRDIEKARFVRLAVEKEVLQRAALCCDACDAERLRACLARQDEAIASRNVDGFAALDYDFHRCLCEIAEADFAFEVIQAEKAKVDRLCMLSLSKEDRMPDLVADHRSIADAVIDNDPERAVTCMETHLSRLDGTIESIAASNVDYFEP